MTASPEGRMASYSAQVPPTTSQVPARILSRMRAKSSGYSRRMASYRYIWLWQKVKSGTRSMRSRTPRKVHGDT